MVPALNNALSGLASAQKRLEVSATNIANQFSTQSLEDGKTVDKPYVPKQVQQVSLPNGGVQANVQDVKPAIVDIVDPGVGLAQMPNVDLEQEMVNQTIASYDFKANLKSIKVADDMQKSLLDIFG